MRTGRTLPVRTVITTSEPLSPGWRVVIEQAFEATVYDNYGCNDGGAWGAQCWERRGFHHDFERSVIQFEDGELITTVLWNTAFPFIRYRNGDAGCWIDGGSPCRRHAPRFTISGRAQDLIVTPTRIISPTTLSQVLLHEGLDDARVVQHARRSIEICSWRTNGSGRRTLPPRRRSCSAFSMERKSAFDGLRGSSVASVGSIESA